MSKVTPESSGFVRLAVLVEGGVLVLALVLAWLLSQPLLTQSGDFWTGLIVGIPATIPLVVVMWQCSCARVGPLRTLMREIEESLVPAFSEASAAALALISVLAGFGEEFLFRGVIQVWLTTWVGPAGGLVLASVLFGLAHLVTRTYAVLAGLIGVYLGLLLILTDNLLVPCIAHGLYDFVALIYLTHRHRLRQAATP